MSANGAPDRARMKFRIKGAAGPYEAAAITAVLEHALAEERRNGKHPAPRRFSNWKMAGWNGSYHRPRQASGPRINGAERPNAPRAIRPRTSSPGR